MTRRGYEGGQDDGHALARENYAVSRSAVPASTNGGPFKRMDMYVIQRMNGMQPYAGTAVRTTAGKDSTEQRCRQQ